MILNPPGLGPGSVQRLPHWPYGQAVDEALTGRGIPPGTVRASRTYGQHGNTMYLVLVWDISRTAGGVGLRLRWEEDTGWAYARLGVGPSIATPTQPLTALHRVFAAPDDVAEVAEHLVRNGRTPTGEYGAEWDRAAHVRATIDRFRATVNQPGGLWTGAE
ncbi:hypothetical protein DMH26_28550 [Streptomyces sp. WAC 05379]|uniref:DUF6292 family protein n=1 Tax=Streptomyces sp. WAC 05379 TaxID=2203207 RepID=UPI000F748DA0|nr:DUF6292 family protein [Streptomyces sp. WAC 05379]RSN90110.1 hypothetical protein DMH26_28550 [Streptomyces sp. WAC 05379]